MTNGCSRVEVLAGAIALGEATEAEREEYRNHIASCASCLAALGGEREIERVMATVAQARDAETWEPLPRRLGERSRARAWRTGAAILAAAVVISLGAHALLATVVSAPSIEPKPLAVEHVVPFHVALEHRARVAATPVPITKATAASTEHDGHPQCDRTSRQCGNADNDDDANDNGASRSRAGSDYAGDCARVECADLASR